MDNFISLFMLKKAELFTLFIQHLNMTTMAVFISLLIGIPVGILITRNKIAAKIVIGIANIMQSIPCIALLAFLIPFVGIGARPAIFMVIIYALLPIIKNTYTGIMGINPNTIEVAKGLGLTTWKRLFKIELPIAMPYIMAGIRISAVAAVGTMTIAAFAGAGGLGWFINLGLNSRNTDLVLLGAIPASLLALVLDLILGLLEKAVTSEGLLPPEKIKNIPRKSLYLNRILITTLCLCLITLPMATSTFKRLTSIQEKNIVIGTSNFTEVVILGYIYSELIEENTDITVKKSFNLNGGSLCFDALDSGKIDMFVEYTGSVLQNYLHEAMNTKDQDELYNNIKSLLKERHNIQLSEPLGFNNTYVMSVTPEIAKQYNLQTLSDILPVAKNLRLGCTVEFVQRGDCLPLLQDAYGIQFKSVSGLDGNIRYAAIENGSVDIIDAFATDALLEKSNLVKLEDDINFFPPYYAVNLVNGDVLHKYPELIPLLAKLDGQIDETTMAELNAQVDIEGRDPKDVAHEFLLEKGLVP